MIPIIGTHLKTKSGDLFTIKELNKKMLRMNIGNTKCAIVGEILKFPEWFKLNDCTILTEEEYEIELPKYMIEQKRRLKEHNQKLKEQEN